jgi:hypothetical protein
MKGGLHMDPSQYQLLMDQLQRICTQLEEIKLDNRDRHRAEKEFWGELLNAVGSVEMAIGP